jgi:hypothetical protein
MRPKKYSMTTVDQQKNGNQPTALPQAGEEFTRIWDGLSHNQRRFVLAMLDCNTKKEAAEHIGLIPDTVYRWPKTVDLAIDMVLNHAREAATSVLRDNLLRAALVKVGGLDSDDEAIAQKTATEIIDRELGRAAQSMKLSAGDGAPVIFQVVYDD